MNFLPKTLSIAELVVLYLSQQGLRRIYGLVGGHIQPLWDAAARGGIEVMDVRHEAAAVYMAHAEAELTGRFAVALVTAGPGLANCVAAICNAFVSRVPVLVISAVPPREQAGRGAMQEIPQADIVRPVTRRIETVRTAHHILEKLDSVVLAALGGDGPRGPVYIDFPTDLLDQSVHPGDIHPLQFTPRTRHRMPPVMQEVEAACGLLAKARRPLVIGGAAVRAARDELVRYLDASGALYLDTGESRGVIPCSHAAYVPAVRSRVMHEADAVVTIGRRLDYQLAYGSSAVFSHSAAFIRIGRSCDETSENRRGDVEIRAEPSLVLAALLDKKGFSGNLDDAWLSEVILENRDRQNRLTEAMEKEPLGTDGRMHPYHLIRTINTFLTDESILVVDGGDILSFARVGLRPVRQLDCGAFGCLGVGVPFATAAALGDRSRQVIALIGDGAFGFTAIEISTAVRHGAKALFIIANNSAWKSIGMIRSNATMGALSELSSRIIDTIWSRRVWVHMQSG
jgi:acetolactate synthase-1/2/3 large subunit